MTSPAEEFLLTPESLHAVEIDDFLSPDEPPLSAVRPEYDDPDPGIVTEPRRNPRAKAYEKKVSSVLRPPTMWALQQPETLPDAAALIMHAPKLSAKLGDLAAVDAKVARGIDWLTEGTENPYAAVIAAALPLFLQLVRNHEPQLEPDYRGIPAFWRRKNPDTGKRPRVRIKFGIKLGRLRNVTNDPQTLAKHVFENPRIVDALRKQGVTFE